MWCYGQLGRTRRTMPATCHQLKLQVWWILSDRRESHDRYLDEYRVFFSEQALLLDVDATFSFSEVYHEPSRNFYEEPIYQLDCTIEWPGITWFGPSAKHLQRSTSAAACKCRGLCRSGRYGCSRKQRSCSSLCSCKGECPVAQHSISSNIQFVARATVVAAIALKAPTPPTGPRTGPHWKFWSPIWPFQRTR
ncbi:uncharacterized protein [Dermacentor albipictus]|uniref:uncharacterized protein isoform X4 n=1 Tax=Dermacentor albipictus TaxID=60249 RepID=UPI0038FC702A